MKMLQMKLMFGRVKVAEFQMLCGMELESIIDQLESKTILPVDPDTGETLSPEVIEQLGGPCHQVEMDMPTALSLVNEFKPHVIEPEEADHSKMVVKANAVSMVRLVMEASLNAVKDVEDARLILFVMPCVVVQ